MSPLREIGGTVPYPSKSCDSCVEATGAIAVAQWRFWGRQRMVGGVT